MIKMAMLPALLKSFVHTIFRRTWPEHLAGLLLGIVNVIFYAWASKPYTIFSGYQIWGQHVYNLINLGNVSGKPLAPILEDKTSVGIIGLFLGASVAAILSNEFKVRLPYSKIQAIEAVFGGILMSLGVVLAFGCNWGGFFSAITALSLHGWAMFLGLIIGGYLGQRYVKWKLSFETTYAKKAFKESLGGLEKRSFLGKGFLKILFVIEIFIIMLLLSYYSYVQVADGSLYGVILLFGIVVGIIIQRSRFCFATAFRDLIYGPEFFRSIRIHKGIILGLLVGVAGGFVLKYRGYVDILNYVAPVSFLNIVGGIIFALGTVLAGACASGILWRAGEGHVSALLAIFTAVLVYPVFRKIVPTTGAGFFIPNLGWAAGTVAIFITILVYYLFILYLEKRVHVK
ncbi:MAG: YeeE/YedE thiosulfate transporter family protein [Nitrososphaeria archaeon]